MGVSLSVFYTSMHNREAVLLVLVLGDFLYDKLTYDAYGASQQQSIYHFLFIMHTI